MKQPKPETVAKCLEEAADKVEQGWTRFAAARDKFGMYVHPTSSDAVEWCAIGGIAATGRALSTRNAARHAATAVMRERMSHYRDLARYNDLVARSGKSVAGLFRVAAKKLRKGELVLTPDGTIAE